MKQLSFKRIGFKLLLLVALALPGITGAQQYFFDSDDGDVNASFRKTGTFTESYEMVAYLGNITNFLILPAGVTINITNYTTKHLTNMCPDNFGNLQWAVFCSFVNDDPLVTSLGNFPQPTCWFTVARTNTSVIARAPLRLNPNSEGSMSLAIVGVSDGANSLASTYLGATNFNDNLLVLLEPISYDSATSFTLTDHIGDRLNSNLGDFGGNAINFSVENTTSNNFTSPAISDFYQDVPSSSSSALYTDPITGLTNGSAYNVGYFTLNPNGSMTFTRATGAPVVGTITSTATNGFAPLTVIFTNTASSGSITQWIWNFGNGVSITNTTGIPATNTYAAGGTYTVILTLVGPGGSTSVTNNGFIVASAKPTIKVAQVSGKLLIFGTNCPAGVQYRIFSFTNLMQPTNTWKPVVTNFFLSNTSFTYTNATTNAASFYRLISP